MICSEGFADLLLTVVTTPLPILIVRCATRSAANLANHKVDKWCNVPARYPWIWQAIALISAWSYPIAQLMSMKLCDFYGPDRHCGIKGGLRSILTRSVASTNVCSRLSIDLLLQQLSTCLVLVLLSSKEGSGPNRHSALRNRETCPRLP